MNNLFSPTSRFGFSIFLSLSFCAALLTTKISAAVISNDLFAKDTSGNPIYAQGGGVFKFGSKWYWYGVKYNGAVTYAGNPSAGKNTDTSFAAFTCYSSTDLVNWTFEGYPMTSSSTNMSGTSWVGRMGVVYNSNTAKYVLVSQYVGTAGSGVMFATSSTPNGAFTWDHVQTSIPTSNGATGDQTVFTDTDGASYLICSNASGRARLYVLPFRASDSLNIEAGTNISTGTGREGNCMFKYNGRYYFCSSDLHGWNASHCYVQDSTAIQGTYGAEYVMSNTDPDFCHVSQTGFFVSVTGTVGTTVFFVGDRWSDFAGNGSGYNQWCPVTFSGSTPIFNSFSKVDFNAARGTWEVGAANNYALNPGFEADRVTQTTVAGWVTDGSPTAGSYGNASGSHNPGRFFFHHYLATAYNALTHQTVTVPNGTYTLKVWYRSSGGQSTCRFFVRNFGGTEIQSNVNTAQSNWTQVTIPNVVVTNGQCDYGVYSVAGAGQWVDVDDWSLTNNSNVYSAEQAVAAAGVTIEANYSGYHGTGFANFPVSGGTLTYTNVDGNGGGSKNLAIRYSNGGSTARTGNLVVNGSTTAITFPATGGWSNWATLNVTVTLNNSLTNTVQFASTGSDLGNIDEIVVP